LSLDEPVRGEVGFEQHAARKIGRIKVALCDHWQLEIGRQARPPDGFAEMVHPCPGPPAEARNHRENRFRSQPRLQLARPLIGRAAQVPDMDLPAPPHPVFDFATGLRRA
jgi:hypothetical protein